MTDYEPTKLDRIANRLIDAAIAAGLDASTLRDANMGRGEAEAYIRDCGSSWITFAVRLISVRAMRADDAPVDMRRFGTIGAPCLGDVPPLDDELHEALTDHLARLIDYEPPERPMFVCGGAVVSLRDLHAAMHDYDTEEKRILAAIYTAFVWRCTASTFGLRDA